MRAEAAEAQVMKEHPILMSAPMVLATLEERKSQTRRVVNPQPPAEARDVGMLRSADASNGQWHWLDAEDIEDAGFVGDWFRCPYGVPGDLLWVRENGWQRVGASGSFEPYYYDASVTADEAAWLKERSHVFRRRPSIHMPRAASRITLRVNDVRVERLQAISEADAIAEGVEPVGDNWKSYEIIHEGRHKGKPNPHSIVPNRSPVTSYRELWEAINGQLSWAANSWVWAVSFERVK